MANTQMNVRIDADVKSRGDAVFRSLGLSTTDVVKAVWSYAAEHEEAPGIVAQALNEPIDATEKLDIQYRTLIAEQAHSIVSDFRRRMGIPAPGKLEEIDYRAMREQGRTERLGNRGLA